MTGVDIGKRNARRLFERIDGLLASYGYGWVGRVERACGWKRGWWRRRRRELSDLLMSDYLNALYAMGLPVAGFLKETVDAELDAGLAGLGLPRPRCEPPRILELVQRREEDAQDEQREWEVHRAYVEELDQLRYRAPERVVTLAEEAVSGVEPATLPLLLGVAASASRTLPVPMLDEAMLVLERGIGLARERGDRMAEGDLMQRLAYVLAADGDPSRALDLAGRAAVIYVDAGDVARLGRVAVDRAMFFDYMGQLDAAIAAGEASLRYLPEEEQRNRFTAFQGLGLCYLRQGDPAKARESAKRAKELLPGLGLGPFAQGKLLWLLGGICRDLGEIETAEAYLRQAVEIFWRVYPLDAAIATTDLVRIQIMGGLHAEARETALRTGELVTPLSKNRLARTAIAELIRASGDALTLAIVDEVRRKLESARDRRKIATSQASCRPLGSIHGPKAS